MKLLRLKINSPFNSLSRIGEKPFELNFRDEFLSESDANWSEFHPFCFAGLNGSGKSNVLEALSNIFYHLEGCANVNQPDNFHDFFQEVESKPNAYELEYYIVPKFKKEVKNKIGEFTISGLHDYNYSSMVKVMISKTKNNIPKMEVIPYPFLESNQKQVIPTVADKKSKQQAGSKLYFPDLIIGYSSGENEILSIPFLKTRLLHFDEYSQAVTKKEVYTEPESKLIYIDYEMSQAVLLSNFIFQEKEVLQPLDDELGIIDIKRFRMNLNLHTIQESKESFNILEQFNNKIKAFKKCATAYYEDDKNLTLDFWINGATKEAFRNNFDGVFSLFQAFQVLYTLNYRKVTPEIKSDVYESKGFYTQGKLPIPSPMERVFHFLDYYLEKRVDDKGTIKRLLLKNLSDGEQQFLHSLGICLMLKGKSALLLLDEPETHFNPDWRSKFISTLKTCLEASESNNLMRDILITSHSPFIISDCYPDKVIVFKKGELPKNARDTNFRTYGTSIDIIMENVFKKNNTIGDLSRSEIEAIQEKIKDKKKLTEKEVIAYKEQTNHLGDSMEKILLFAQLNELKKEKNA